MKISKSHNGDEIILWESEIGGSRKEKGTPPIWLVLACPLLPVI